MILYMILMRNTPGHHIDHNAEDDMIFKDVENYFEKDIENDIYEDIDHNDNDVIDYFDRVVFNSDRRDTSVIIPTIKLMISLMALLMLLTILSLW